MSELKVRLYQASFNPSHPWRRQHREFLFKKFYKHESWERDDENNFAELYFCSTPFSMDNYLV